MKILSFRFLLLISLIMPIAWLTACKQENENQTAIDKPILVASIKPLHAIVAAIAGDQFDTRTLIPIGSSPHFYTLKPSDRQALSKASIVFRIHPELEQHLNKTLNTLPKHVQQLTLANAEGVQLRQLAHDDDHHHAHGTDTHIWLDPNNAIAIAQAIRDRLQAIDAGNAKNYADNTNALIDAIQQTDKQIKAQLQPLQKRPYLVQHDAWQYFERHYQLNKVASIKGLSGQSIGAASLRRLFSLIKAQDIQCLFIDPDFKPSTAKLLQQETGIKTATLDPLGSRLKIDFNTYPQLLQQAADSIENCLMDEK